jgi:hypothetical protein
MVSVSVPASTGPVDFSGADGAQALKTNVMAAAAVTSVSALPRLVPVRVL